MIIKCDPSERCEVCQKGITDPFFVTDLCPKIFFCSECCQLTWHEWVSDYINISREEILRKYKDTQ
jgi:hypothetical protein